MGSEARHTPWMPTADDMPEEAWGGKRCNVVRADIGPDYPWWTGHGKDESCQIEGTPCHWHWLAYQIVGLVPPGSQPYASDKPLPFSKYYVQACVNACAGLNPEAVPDLVKACEAAVLRLDYDLGQADIRKVRDGLLAALAAIKGNTP